MQRKKMYNLHAVFDYPSSSVSCHSAVHIWVLEIPSLAFGHYYLSRLAQWTIPRLAGHIDDSLIASDKNDTRVEIDLFEATS